MKFLSLVPQTFKNCLLMSLPLSQQVLSDNTERLTMKQTLIYSL